MTLDPLGDVEDLQSKGAKKNYARVGSSRPSSLIYTYGPGAIMDLPNFTVMPGCLNDWDRVYAKRDGEPPTIHAPRLLEAARTVLRHRVDELRSFPWQPQLGFRRDEGRDLGVPCRVFPQWLRCTGCDRLAPLTNFEYGNTHPFRTDEAKFEHGNCPGRRGDKRRRARAVPARYLLACVEGHLDEFPYGLWVHHGQACPEAQAGTALKMIEGTAGRGAMATIQCAACGAKRPMGEAQGEAGRAKLPTCRGRHPHLDAFDESCGLETHLMLVGASNLWFPVIQSIIAMPLDSGERKADLADRIRLALGDKLAKYASDLEVVRDLLDGKVDVGTLSDADLAEAVQQAQSEPESAEQAQQRFENWDPVDLLVPEWNYLQLDPIKEHHRDPISGLTLSKRQRAAELPVAITRVLAVERLRRVNTLLGFTRIDELDRVNDPERRLAPIARGNPKWLVATEDVGEGMFLELDETLVQAWEAKVERSRLWRAHQGAHLRNFENRISHTATNYDAATRLKPPRYWLLHTLAHLLIREFAMTSGYGAASLSERIYAWQGDEDRPPAAGLLLLTTASDSDGTLGGLVRLSRPELLLAAFRNSLHKATRCSSDPVCSNRTPRAPEDFLHGAACHCCCMASETSCERANRFLDRRFLLSLPGEFAGLGFFGRP